jgi:hypothetical protein
LTYNFDGSSAVRAPDYLKKALIDYLETGEVELPSYPAYLASLASPQARLQWLTEELWDCTERLPPMYCDDLGLHGRASYGEAARYLRHREDTRSARSSSFSS